MRDVGMSSNASTSATIVKRSNPNIANNSINHTSPSTVTPTPTVSAGSRCRCCPYGFHIDLGFVSYAQDVTNGFISRQGTPTNMHHKSGIDRPLMSPLDSVFSDSLENLMSDFEEALAPLKAPAEPKISSSREKDVQEIKNRLQNGYSSDYTVYRRGTSYTTDPKRPNGFDLPSKSLTRPSALNYNGSRSNTPTVNGKSSTNNNNNNTGYSTALAKTVSEIRARNSESPFPDSRVNTPIDLGLNLAYSTSNGFHQTPPSYRSTTPSRLARDDLPPTPSPMFRRAPSHGDLPGSSEFTSLRRGREYALPDVEPSSRVRFFSASPKMPRRLQLSTAPAPIVDSHFTYSHQQNGETVLSRTQATCTSPVPEKPIPTPTVTRSIATTTGPLPPQKPCAECPKLRKEIEEVIQRLPPPPPEKFSIAISTETITLEDKSVGSDPVSIQHVGIGTENPELVEFGTDAEVIRILHVDTQTEVFEEVDKKITVDTASSPIIFETPEEEEPKKGTENEAQTDPLPDYNNSTSSECFECLKKLDTFTRNVGVGACTIDDKICVNCDGKLVEETNENEAPGFKVEVDDRKQREFEMAKANAVKKLLTNEQKSNFQRGTAVSKSARFDRKKSVDDLDYIIDKKASQKLTTSPPTIPIATTSTPTAENSEALKTKVLLKKEIPAAASNVPEPVAARIPRPKISKWATPEEAAETPDEEEEAQDRLTPLRSELRTLGNRWARNTLPNPNPTAQQLPYSTEDLSDSDAESDCSVHSDGTFDVTDDVFDVTPFEMSDKLREAIENFNSSLLEPGSVPEETVEWSAKLVQHEWMKTAARKTSRYEHVDKFVEELRNLGPKILHEVINLSDQNGNTALHYVVSHANFPVVSSILDSGECELNKPNMAGYTAVMLAALSSLEDDMERAVVQRLFEMGDVNAKATPHGQTALMLAVSHGKTSTTELLLECGADVNVQDEEGSTALMCAAEHGHKEIVKMLLSQPGIDPYLTDCDSSSALSIAIENGHRDIGILVYAHQNYSKLDASGPTSVI